MRNTKVRPRRTNALMRNKFTKIRLYLYGKIEGGGVEKIWLTFFGAGFLPKAPGSWGSLCAVPLVIFLQNYPLKWTFFLVFFFLITGFFSAKTYLEKHPENTDPKEIVLDEVIGMMLASIFCQGNLKLIALSFLAFRLLDIKKPWPICTLEKIGKGDSGKSAAIFLDDIAAGLTTSLLIWGLRQA